MPLSAGCIRKAGERASASSGVDMLEAGVMRLRQTGRPLKDGCPVLLSGGRRHGRSAADDNANGLPPPNKHYRFSPILAKQKQQAPGGRFLKDQFIQQRTNEHPTIISDAHLLLQPNECNAPERCV